VTGIAGGPKGTARQQLKRCLCQEMLGVLFAAEVKWQNQNSKNEQSASNGRQITEPPNQAE